MAQERDRRAAPRTGMERHAMFVAIDGSTLLQSGVVIDMSRDGLHLRTRQPAPVGSVIEIEMDPRAGATSSAPVIVRGRIVRVQELRGGEYSVGVKLRYRVGKTDASRTKAAAAPPPSKASPAPAPTAKNKFSVDWRQWAVLGFFVALIGVLLLWPRQNPASAVTNGAGSGATKNSLKEAIAETMKRPRAPNNGGVSRGSSSDRDYTVLPLMPRDESAKNPTERVSRLEDAQPGNTQKKPLHAPIQSVHDGYAEINDTAESDLQASSQPDGTLLTGGVYDGAKRRGDARRGRVNRASIDSLPTGVALLASARNAGEPQQENADRTPEIVLIVDRKDFTLTVVRDGRFHAQYPISIGANDSTPTGTFTIHNKIRNPDWYNRGETVPHGDPRNPLGGFWMGFAKDGKPLSYGIHATTDASLIGQPTGRGCIRLTSEHTGELFQSCDAGATVVVR